MNRGKKEYTRHQRKFSPPSRSFAPGIAFLEILAFMDRWHGSRYAGMFRKEQGDYPKQLHYAIDIYLDLFCYIHFLLNSLTYLIKLFSIVSSLVKIVKFSYGICRGISFVVSCIHL